MLSADLVRARRRGDKLTVQSLKAADRQAALEMGSGLLETLRGSVGETAEDVGQALGGLDRESRHEKLFAGLKKLVLDECAFGMPLDVDAPALRKKVFEAASAARQSLEPGEVLDRNQILAEIAAVYETTPDRVEEGLFGDLKGAQRLTQAPSISKEELVSRYEVAQLQGVLLKAVRMSAVVECSNPEAYRRLFQKLKFRQLLFRLDALDKGYRIEIEGPFSLFESVTKYGLQLALIVPALLACDKVELTAELRWGKERRSLNYETSWSKAAVDPEVGEVRSEVRTLLSTLEKKETEFSVEIASEIMNIPGVGLCIPDLKFSSPDHPDVFLEVLGFWSREAVWNRVEWAQSGGHERVVFAASSRLRVSEEVLAQECGASLYVFKGKMSAPAVLSRVRELAQLA